MADQRIMLSGRLSSDTGTWYNTRLMNVIVVVDAAIHHAEIVERRCTTLSDKSVNGFLVQRYYALGLKVTPNDASIAD